MEPSPLRLLLVTVALAFTLELTGSANAQRRATPAQAPVAAPSVPAVPQQPVTQERLPAPPTPPTEVRVISTPEADPSSRPEVRQERDLDAQWLMAYAGIAVAFFTLGQAFLTGIGIHYLRRTLRATDAAVAEAKSATKAAEDAVAVTKDSAERQLRAYVGVNEALSTWRNGPSAQIEIKNGGQTPAYELTHWVTTGYGPADRADFPTQPARQSSVLGAGASINTDTAVAPGNGKVHGAIREGAYTLFVWGRIEYQDAFGVRRMTEYRLMWVEGGDHGRLVFCDEGNSAT